jgi:hypothetical protein
VAEAIRDRVTASCRFGGPLSELQKTALAVASDCEAHPESFLLRDTQIKLAEQIDRFDRLMKISNRVAEGRLPPVEEVIFGLTASQVKEAAAEHAETITGSIYRTADLNRVPLAKVSEQLGPELAAAMTSNGATVDVFKAAAILPTLPRPDARLFEELAAQAGVEPIAKEASADIVKLERDFLLELSKS